MLRGFLRGAWDSKDVGFVVLRVVLGLGAAAAGGTHIRQIPYTPVAGPLGFEKHGLYDPPEAETADVDIGRMFSDAGGPEEATGS